MGEINIDRRTLTTKIDDDSVNTDSIVKAEATSYGTVIYTLDDGSTREGKQEGWD